VVNVVRDDINEKFDETDQILDLAPSREDDFFKVPKIIKE